MYIMLHIITADLFEPGQMTGVWEKPITGLLRSKSIQRIQNVNVFTCKFKISS